MTLRCAVYTRKSSEEGLEQDFNSLHAQREACEAYITSQKHEGWQLVKQHYDDGGFSGGNMNRPGLQALLKDIESGKVNVVVVYKVDRLTRSLADFAKIIESFDQRKVFFVSVTQQFNTTSSMGRLTLNMLLSFAQFEREVTGERIRDKIAASKAKGMWMGGSVPMGYKVDKRKLIIVPEDAKKAQNIFRRYLELGCVNLVQRELSESGVRSSRGKIIARGSIYKMLSNPIYIAQIRHKGKCYPGQHEAIIEQELWDKVQDQLTGNRKGIKRKGRKAEICPLAGKLFDRSGERLVPVHARKGGRRYRYYISESFSFRPAAETPNGWRLPGAELEHTVAQAVRRMLGDHKGIASVLREAGLSGQDVPEAFARAKTLRARLGVDSEKADTLMALVSRVELHQDGLVITLRLQSLLRQPQPVTLAKLVMTQEIAMRMQRRSVETKLIIGGDETAKVDPVLKKAIARGHVWFNELLSGEAWSIDDIVKKYGVGKSHVSNLLPLAFLAPDIVEAVLVGKHSPMLTLEMLTKHIHLPMDWKGQQEILEFRPTRLTR